MIIGHSNCEKGYKVYNMSRTVELGCSMTLYHNEKTLTLHLHTLLYINTHNIHYTNTILITLRQIYLKSQSPHSHVIHVITLQYSHIDTVHLL